MELFGKHACFVQQRHNSAGLLGSLSSSAIVGTDFCPRWSPSQLLLLPRISHAVVSRTSDRKYWTLWQWVCQRQDQRADRLRVETRATVSARRRSIIGRRRSTSRRPEGSGGVNVDLELEILAFMLQSTNSNAFPSKEELLCAGRHDLVDAIISEGGWLAAGWEKKANVSSLGSGVPEIAHRPPSRQRALRSKTKAVRSSRQRRGRPKPVERRALSNDESTCENSEPNESQQDATQGRSDGENIGSERDGNSIDDSGAAPSEPAEKDRNFSSDGKPALPFSEVRKDQGSRFPSPSVQYLWEFGSLSHFIEDRKLDTTSGMMQRQQRGLSDHSSVRKCRSDSGVAKRGSKICDKKYTSGDAKSKDDSFVKKAGLRRARQGSKCEPGRNVNKGLDSACTVKQDSRVDLPVNTKAELDNGPTLGQDSKGSEGTLGAAAQGVQDLENRQVPIPQPKVDKPVISEQETSINKASSSEEQPLESPTNEPSSRELIIDAEAKIKEEKKQKKKKRRKMKTEKPVEVVNEPVESNGTLDWINQMVDQREKWMLEAKPSIEEGTSDKPKSVQDRIRSLEDKLSATRTALQSGREALGRKGDEQEQPNIPSDSHLQRLSKLRDASDQLEYTENKILRTYSELTTTRAQVAALEGKHGLEIRDVLKVSEDKVKKIEKATTGLQSLLPARIVWPNPAKEVFLIGSFDGWNQKIKMELSGAGVFLATVPLHPGRYEIKFIVDGTWRVDTARPIVYGGGYENNVLTIPETFPWRH
ncbi:hypothetical protein MPTK1_4g23780 [Marchantia polymorpha subsp. ruderalis]|uniref:AMP-activated protein kinase glycogen-binding domain-containing protein n=2 Tax=Marchantia polymorpha TaxID=3197 RepID=A0AAF6BD40_MARPO|nr:hypothetical protein MARPO_0020s0141 [Marchantia polymorpha]BBN09924.1 hypothetical protein Mp_4g23780 [Marchantia polymorpha subsp. ruderalis]|eukprot:PTQ44503.1 hypothetical protein MARPO_0020s0141 [Marchantia polymorpha]